MKNDDNDVVKIKDPMDIIAYIKSMPTFPKTRGDLEFWLCDIIDNNIGCCNEGCGWTNDILFKCITYIASNEGKIEIPEGE